MMEFLSADLSLGASAGAGAGVGAGVGAGALAGALESGVPSGFADLLAARTGAEALGPEPLELASLEAGALALADEGDAAATDMVLAPPALAAAPLAASRLNRLAVLADWAALPTASVEGTAEEAAEGAESGRAALLSDAGEAGEPELLTQLDAGVAPVRSLVVRWPDALAVPKAVVVSAVVSAEASQPRVAEAVVGSAAASVRASPPVLALAARVMVTPEAARVMVTPEAARPMVTPEAAQSLVAPGAAQSLVAPEAARSLVAPGAARPLVLPLPGQPLVLAKAAAEGALPLVGPDAKPGPQPVTPVMGVRGDAGAGARMQAVAPVTVAPVTAAPVTVSPIPVAPGAAASGAAASGAADSGAAALLVRVVPVASATREVSRAVSIELPLAPVSAPSDAPLLEAGAGRRGLGAPEAAPVLLGAERTLVGAEPVVVGAGAPVVGSLAADAPRAAAPADGRGGAMRAAVVDQGVGAGLGLGPVAVSASLEGAANVRMALSGGRDALQVALTVPDAVAATARARSDDLMGALADQGVRLAALSVSAGSAAQGSGSERGQERGGAFDGGGPFQSGQQAQQQARQGGQPGGQAQPQWPANSQPDTAAGAGLAAVDEMKLSRTLGRGADRFA